MEAQSKPPGSLYVRVCLFLAIGYGPLIAIDRNYMSLEWLGEFMNEALAWLLILSGFDLLVIMIAVKIFRRAPVFAVASILLALYPMQLGWRALYENGIGPSSNADQDPYISFIGFWLFGGGEEVILFLLLPLTIVYVYLRFRERNKVEIARAR